MALSNAGIAAPESDEMLAATHEKYIQALVTWVKDRKPFQPAPVVPPAIEPDYEVIKSILPTANPDEYACCIAADMWNACRAAMLQAGNHTEQHLDMVDHSGDANEKGSDGTFIDEGTKQAGNSPVIPDGSFSGLVNSARALLDALYEFGADEVDISEYVTNLEDALRVAAAPKQEGNNG